MCQKAAAFSVAQTKYVNFVGVWWVQFSGISATAQGVDPAVVTF